MQGTRPEELQQMIKVSRDDRYAKRNECMLLVGFSFGLRVSELLYLKVEDIDLENGQIHLERLKNGKTHDPAITRVVQRSLKAYLKERGTKPTSFLFPSQWKPEKPLSRGHFHKWFSETAQAAGLDVAKQHPPRCVTVSALPCRLDSIPRPSQRLLSPDGSNGSTVLRFGYG